ncbi:MAG TPA: hypothetical protein V6D27_00910 [Vampirovibrionales bacterium]
MAIVRRPCGACSRGMTSEQMDNYDKALRLAYQAHQEFGAESEAAKQAKKILLAARGISPN